ncbi:hypothetical protein O9929_09660 [Vibrio lentus]|nr:hypothetical protein [Vibrio lentus]
MKPSIDMCRCCILILDIIFNSLVLVVSSRAKFQIAGMVILVEEVKGHLVVTIRDHGMPFPKLASAINER